MSYRTRTYIAADWTDDKNAVEQLMYWKKQGHLSFNFLDAHDLSSSSDASLNCSIKKNCTGNLDCSKFFVLIVGEKTKTLRAGYCSYCLKRGNCNYVRANKSYVEYECDYATRNDLPVIVLYNSRNVDKSKCIDSVVNIAKTHIAMHCLKDGKVQWDYQAIKNAFANLE